jgi:hypothetical protein
MKRFVYSYLCEADTFDLETNQKTGRGPAEVSGGCDAEDEEAARAHILESAELSGDTNVHSIIIRHDN